MHSSWDSLEDHATGNIFPMVVTVAAMATCVSCLCTYLDGFCLLHFQCLVWIGGIGNWSLFHVQDVILIFLKVLSFIMVMKFFDSSSASLTHKVFLSSMKATLWVRPIWLMKQCKLCSWALEILSYMQEQRHKNYTLAFMYHRGRRKSQNISFQENKTQIPIQVRYVFQKWTWKYVFLLRNLL